MSIAIRDFQADDAAGVSALFRAIYGEHYVYPDVYLPSMIRRHNAAGRWHSAVAVRDGRVLGHAALWRDPHCPGSAELALNVVHPDARGQGLATALGRHLRAQGVALGLSMLTIKQVSSHGQSQRLAKTLGFHTTGLLLDYVASPFGQPQPESIVLGCLPLQSRPIPALNWPAAWREWLTPLSRAFGSAPPPEQGPAGGLSIASHGRRLEVGLEDISGGRLREVAALPTGRLVYVRLALGPEAPRAAAALQQAGFVCGGLVPGPDGSWQALLLRGPGRQELALSCPLASRLLELSQAQMPADAA
jgi:GNAT superfamily N-acetyltransferase